MKFEVGLAAITFNCPQCGAEIPAGAAVIWAVGRAEALDTYMPLCWTCGKGEVEHLGN